MRWIGWEVVSLWVGLCLSDLGDHGRMTRRRFYRTWFSIRERLHFCCDTWRGVLICSLDSGVLGLLSANDTHTRSLVLARGHMRWCLRSYTLEKRMP